MAVSQSDLDEAYAAGQRDGANNRYDPPVSIWKRASGFVSEDEFVLLEYYDKGYEHARSQR